MSRTHQYNHQRTTKPFYLYRAYDASRALLYIGITTSVSRRVSEHRMTKSWWPTVACVESQLIGPRVVAQAAEAAAMRAEHPRHNVLRAGPWSKVGQTLAKYMDEQRVGEAEIARTAGVDRMTVRSWLGK